MQYAASRSSSSAGVRFFAGPKSETCGHCMRHCPFASAFASHHSNRRSNETLCFSRPRIKSRGMRRLPRAFPRSMCAGLLLLCFALWGVLWASASSKQTGRPRITGIDHVTIYVSDVEKSRRFYSDVLGLTVVQYSGLETFFRVLSSEQGIL